jgi:hypothetical protein
MARPRIDLKKQPEFNKARRTWAKKLTPSEMDRLASEANSRSEARARRSLRRVKKAA